MRFVLTADMIVGGSVVASAETMGSFLHSFIYICLWKNFEWLGWNQSYLPPPLVNATSLNPWLLIYVWQGVSTDELAKLELNQYSCGDLFRSSINTRDLFRTWINTSACQKHPAIFRISLLSWFGWFRELLVEYCGHGACHIVLNCPSNSLRFVPSFRTTLLVLRL